jgi:hypothetical protein
MSARVTKETAAGRELRIAWHALIASQSALRKGRHTYNRALVRFVAESGKAQARRKK